jgi:hypothetical protein
VGFVKWVTEIHELSRADAPAAEASFVTFTIGNVHKCKLHKLIDCAVVLLWGGGRAVLESTPVKEPISSPLPQGFSHKARWSKCLSFEQTKPVLLCSLFFLKSNIGFEQSQTFPSLQRRNLVNSSLIATLESSVSPESTGACCSHLVCFALTANSHFSSL